MYSVEEMNGGSNVKQLMKPEVDSELDKMRGMNKEEAAAYAAKRVAEAEVAIAEAEEAARIAEAAQANAETAQAFLEAVMATIKNRNFASSVEQTHYFLEDNCTKCFLPVNKSYS